MSDQDPNIGSNRDDEPVSLSGLVSTLVPVLVVAGIYFLIFLILRRSQRRWYAPRTYIGSLPSRERSPALSSGLLGWIPGFARIPDVYALKHQSLDAYLYLRYLKMTVVITFVGCCITWPVLFPVNATGGGVKRQLDILSFANVGPDQKNRYYAHVFVAWLFYGFVMYLILRECIYYITLRQVYLLSPISSSRISSRTVLFTSVPTPYLDERKLRKVFGNTIKNIWITGDVDKLDKLVEERDKAAFTLEKAEVKLIKLANKERLAAIKKGGAVGDDKTQGPLDAESGSIAARWVPEKKRPAHRTGPLGLVGKKVDSINWCRTELERLIPEVEKAQAQYRSGDYKKINAVFIEFKSQSEAEVAFQALTHHLPLHMAPRYIGVKPDEIVWASLTVSWWQRVVRRYLVQAFIAALIIFWAIPVGVVGAISNVQKLKSLSFLTWLDKVPQVIMGVITGLLPAVLLSVLMSLVPVIMRLCAKLSGEPTLSRVELFTQNAYFAFQVIQLFLITTLTSAASSVVIDIINNPLSATDLLASNLPLASNVYISYFLVQGLTIAAGVVSQVVGFVIFTLMYKFLAGTPRALYTKWSQLSAISWGSTMPVYTNITVIAITYAAIAPLVLGFAFLGMLLFYLAWRYNVFFVTDTKIDTRGLIYPRALKQLFTGIYLSELCMIGLFGASAAPGPAVLMVAFLVFTVLFQASLSNALDPLLYNMPQSLLAEEESRRADLGATAGSDPGPSGKNGVANAKETEAAPEPKRSNFIVKFLKPWIYADYPTLRQLLPREDEGYSLDLIKNLYKPEDERNAYFPPSVSSEPPLLWIPKDAAGVSKQEIAHTSKVISITDEGAELDEKNRIVWDRDTTRPAIWNEKVLY